MDAIAVIDDREQMRTTVAALIRLELEGLSQEWRVVDVPPLAQLDDYLPWIKENDIRVLILDEMLSEDVPDNAEAVAYSGHNVAESVRARLPDLPQFIVTSVTDFDDLDASAADLDAIIKRKDFNDRPRLYVERMLRMGKSYVERFESELAELTEISERLVSGTATNEDRERIAAIRAVTQSQYPLGQISDLRQWIDTAEAVKRKIQEALQSLRDESRS